MAARLAAAVLALLVYGSAAGAAGGGMPTMEMLEFLADFETAAGRGVDPLQFATTAPVKKEPAKKVAKKHKKRQGQVAPAGAKGVNQ